LLARRSEKNVVRLTGWGAAAYSLVLAVEILFGSILPALVLLPALLWIGAALHLIPERVVWGAPADRAWMVSFIPILILALVNPWASVIVVVALLLVAGLVLRSAAAAQFRSMHAVIGVIALFFGLGVRIKALVHKS
jgi:hypothetical protein